MKTSPDRPASRAAQVYGGITLVTTLAVFALADAVPQPPSYFDFADSRTIGGIANFWNVTTNVLFLLPGAAGLWLLRRSTGHVLQALHPAYHALFAGVFLTAFGSAWFHLAPDNDTLFWDRLPMTIGFMALTAIVFGEHVSVRLGRVLLWPLLAVGFGSVVYWDYTESQGAGDLRLYALVQFLPMVLIPLVLVTCRSAFDRTAFVWLALLLYGAAKGFEHFDAAVFAAGEILSGHSVKHIAAAAAAAVLLVGGARRRLRPGRFAED